MKPPDDTDTSRSGRVVREYLDIILGGTGSIGAVVAITVLTSWPYALLLGSIALIALAMVVPQWD